MDKEYLQFPFLGSLEDGETFEYLLVSIHKGVASIAITNWFTLRVKLHVGEKVYLHLPTFQVERDRRNEERGKKILSVEHNEEMNADIYQLTFSKEHHGDWLYECSLNKLIEHVPNNHSLIGLLTGYIKDSMILKQGISIYLKHLIPYFSRIVDFSQHEYKDLKKHFLQDIVNRVNEHAKQLEKLYQVIKANPVVSKEIVLYIDLEDLREILESEISFTLFNIVFAEKNGLTKLDYIAPQTDYAIHMYLNAVKCLEKRLYLNYNYIVLIYLNSLNNN